MDVCYPRDHIGLYMDIIEHGGGILSNFHREPSACNEFSNEEPDHQRTVRCSSGNGGKGEKWFFDYSRYGTGAGKGCLCPSGPLDSPLSAGCNHLIQQGAGILLNPKNLLEEWGIETNVLCRNTEIKNEKNKKVLESTDDLVYSCVGLYPKNVDQIAQESRVEIRKLMSILVTLELQGYIREITKNYYIRIK